MSSQGSPARTAPTWLKRTARVTRGRVLAVMAVFLLSFAIGYSGYQRVAAAPPAASTTVPVTRGTITASVAASGTVVAAKQARLSFGVAGRLKSLNVSVGDSVSAGQVLAELDTTSLEIKLEQSQSSLRTAQTKLQQLKNSVKDVDVAAARAAYESALAKYNDLLAGPSAAELKSAEQAVISAQANLQKAEQSLADLKAGPTPDEVVVAKADLEKKQAALQKAQGDYDKVAWRADVASRPEALALQQATIDYQVALANYNQKMAGAKPEEIALAEKNVEGARAALESAEEKLAQLKAGPKAADLEAARSNLASAQAALANKTAGPSAEEIALQEEQIKVAQIAVRQAEIDLASAKIVAPYAGVVAAIASNVGEQVGGGTAVITLVDPQAVRIDATVDEADVGKVAVGQTAEITFDALPNERFAGKVLAVAPSATVQQGVVTYQVSLQIEQRGRTLPAGMTANVSLIVAQKDNVLMVPNRAIRTQGRARVVEVETAAGTYERRQVRVGLSNDQMSEIVEGLSEGEQVVIPSTTTALPRGLGASGGMTVRAAGPAPAR